MFRIGPRIPPRVTPDRDVTRLSRALPRPLALSGKFFHGADIIMVTGRCANAGNSFPDLPLPALTGHGGDSDTLPGPGVGNLGRQKAFGGNRRPIAVTLGFGSFVRGQLGHKSGSGDSLLQPRRSSAVTRGLRVASEGHVVSSAGDKQTIPSKFNTDGGIVRNFMEKNKSRRAVISAAAGKCRETRCAKRNHDDRVESPARGSQEVRMSEPIVYISNRQPIMASRCLELSAKGKTPPSAAPLILAGDPTHSFTVVYYVPLYTVWMCCGSVAAYQHVT